MIVLQKESKERRGLLVQFHEEDLKELLGALFTLRRTSKAVPEWVGRLEAAIMSQMVDNRGHPRSLP